MSTLDEEFLDGNRHAPRSALVRSTRRDRAFRSETLFTRARTPGAPFGLDAYSHRETPKETHEACRRLYAGCWRTMFHKRLRLRTDGLYVSRNTYIKPGAKTMENAKCVHLVVYYRIF